VTLVATEAGSLQEMAQRSEDDLLVARLVPSGGDEVDLLRLAASGLLVNRAA
jgi:hypothetical protein